MIKPILHLTESELQKDSFLRKRSATVTPFGDDTSKIIQDLVDTLNNHEIAVGLSAVQIGVLQRIFIVDLQKIAEAVGDKIPKQKIMVFFNPTVMKRSKIFETEMEACMSIPFFEGEVIRPSKVTVDFQTTQGKRRKTVAKGLLARVIQHEIDHLDGILYPDRMEAGQKLLAADFFD